MDDVLTTEIMLDAFSQVDLKQLYRQMQQSETPPFYPPFQMPTLAPIPSLPEDKAARRIMDSFIQVVTQGRKSGKYLAQAQDLYKAKPRPDLGMWLGYYLSQWDLPAFESFYPDYLKAYPTEGSFSQHMRCLAVLMLLEKDRPQNPQAATLKKYQDLLAGQDHLLAHLEADSDASTLMETYFVQAVWYLDLNIHHAHILYFLNVCFRIQEHYADVLPVFAMRNTSLEDALLYWFQRMSNFYEGQKDFYLPLVEKHIAQYVN